MDPVVRDIFLTELERLGIDVRVRLLGDAAAAPGRSGDQESVAALTLEDEVRLLEAGRLLEVERARDSWTARPPATSRVARLLRAVAAMFVVVRKVEAPPLGSLLTLASIAFGRKTTEMVFAPLVADARCELFEALKAGDKGEARRIRLRSTLALLHAMCRQVPWSVLRTLWKLIGGGS